MRFCQIMTFVPTYQVVELARVAEDVGFDSVAFSDHVVYPIGMSTPYPYAADGMPTYGPDSTWLDPLVAIAACAGVTSTLQFFTNIYVLGYRHPVAAAKAISTTALVSGHRFALGVGAGWMREEFDVLDQPYERRGARMVEGIEVLRKLWSGQPVEHHGEFYDFTQVQMSPAPDPQVPILVGGHTDLAVQRAAAIGDGWLGLDYEPDELRRILARLRELRTEAGRAHEPFEIVTGLRAKPDPDVCAEFAELGVTTLLTSAFGFGHTDPTDLAANRDALQRYAARFIDPTRMTA